MQRVLLLSFLCLSLILTGCQERPKLKPTQNEQLDVDLARLSTNQPIDQTYSHQAKESLKKNKDLNSINAVNTDKDMVITFEVNHLKRFQLEKIRKQVEKKMKKKFSDLEVLVSTDQKIILGLDQIKQNIQLNNMSKKKLEKEIKDLISLAKEET